MSKHRNNSSLITLLLALFTSINASASDDNSFTAGIGIGASQFQLNKPSLVSSYNQLSNSSSFSEDATAFSIFAGMTLDEYLSLEMDLILSGDVTAKEGNSSIKLFDITGLSITSVLSKQVSPKIRLFSRIGAHFWDISEGSDSEESISSAVDLTYGAGINFNLYGSRSRQFRFQWNRYHFDDVFIKTNDIFSVSLIFLFDDSDAKTVVTD